MVKTTEGVVVTSSQTGNSKKLPNKIAQHLPHVNADLNSLPKITRQLFVDDVRKAIGDDIHSLPIGLHSVLQELLDATEEYLAQGGEQAFMEQCQEAIEHCSQGWSYLSYWVSTEQSLCYSIYWSLRAAIERHQKQMTLYLGSKNDGKPQNDSDPPLSPDPKIASLQDWKSKKEKQKDVLPVSKSSFSQTIVKVFGTKAQCTQESFIKQYHTIETDTLDQFELVQQQKIVMENKEAKKEA